MRAAAAALVLAACSFEHGASTQPDAACTPQAPWFRQGDVRYHLDTGGAPTGYTIAVDDTPLRGYFGGEGLVTAWVTVDHMTEVDRVFEDGKMYVKVPPEGDLWVYAGFFFEQLPFENPNGVFQFSEGFDSEASLDRFDLQPRADWSRIEYPYGLGVSGALRVTGSGRHPGAIKNLLIGDGEISTLMRVRAGTGQQHNGLAARGKSMQPATMDGFVGQLQTDVQHVRIAEYSDGISPPAELSTIDHEILRDRWYRLRLRFVGDVVTLTVTFSYASDPVVLTTTRSGWDGTLVGLFAHDCDVEFDDVRVKPALDPEPIATLGPVERRTCD